MLVPSIYKLVILLSDVYDFDHSLLLSRPQNLTVYFVLEWYRWFTQSELSVPKKTVVTFGNSSLGMVKIAFQVVHSCVFLERLYYR